jgi:hypothetical protein
MWLCHHGVTVGTQPHSGRPSGYFVGAGADAAGASANRLGLSCVFTATPSSTSLSSACRYAGLPTLPAHQHAMNGMMDGPPRSSGSTSTDSGLGRSPIGAVYIGPRRPRHVVNNPTATPVTAASVAGPVTMNTTAHNASRDRSATKSRSRSLGPAGVAWVGGSFFLSAMGPAHRAGRMSHASHEQIRMKSIGTAKLRNSPYTRPSSAMFGSFRRYQEARNLVS